MQKKADQILDLASLQMFHLTAESCPIGEPTFGGQAGKTSSTFRYIFFFLCISPKMSAAPLRVMCSQRTAEKAGKGAALMHPLEFQKCHLKIPSVAKSTLKLPDPEEHASGLTSNCCGPTTWDLVEIPDREQDKDRLSVPVSDHTVCHPFVVIAIIKYQKVLALFHR